MKAWHFLHEDRRLGYRDGRVVEPGQTITVDVDPELCVAGLHASVRALDALRYAPGPVVCRIVLGGTIVRGDDKIAGTERTCLWMYDATPVLRAWSRRCALDVIRLWDAPEVVVRYLKTGDESIRDAAWDAARAAWDAARAAACAAARDAARDAAWDAAWAAAWDAAWDAAREKQARRLGAMLAAGRPR